MDKNAFLLYNEVVYHLHTCEDLEDLKRSLLAQVKLIIPCAYISLIEVAIDPDTRAIRHQNPLCLPESFREVWRRPGSAGTTRTRPSGSATPPSPW